MNKKKDFLDRIHPTERQGDPSLLAIAFGVADLRYDKRMIVGLIIFLIIPAAITFYIFQNNSKTYFENNLGVYPKAFEISKSECGEKSKRLVINSDKNIETWRNYYSNVSKENNWEMRIVLPYLILIKNKCGMYSIEIFENKNNSSKIVLIFPGYKI